MATRADLVRWLREVADPSLLRVGVGNGWPVPAEVNVGNQWQPVALHVSTVIEQGKGRPNPDRCRIEPPTESSVAAPGGRLPIAVGLMPPSRTVVLWDVRNRVGRVARSSLYGSWEAVRLAADKGWFAHFNAKGEPVVAADISLLPEYVKRLLSNAPLVDAPAAPPSQFGVPFTPRKRRPRTAPVDPFTIDPALIERGNAAHEAVVEQLSAFLKARGIQAVTPGPTQPEFDLAWSFNGTIYVAEVKSLTDANEDKQLRLGLGQVLWYRQLLADAIGEVRAVLVAEREPRDVRWGSVCQGTGVILAWPEVFDVLLTA